ncbi:hypothetical protein ACROYT_G031169 [Oculina patagonica]
METTINTALLIIVSFVAKVFTSNRTFTCGILNVSPAEYEGINFFVNQKSYVNNVSVTFKELKPPEKSNLLNQASLLLQQNVVVLIEGNLPKPSACSLSEVTGIPLIRLHGDSRPCDQCERAIQMSAEYKDYAHATLDILNKFGWKSIVANLYGILMPIYV